MKKNLLMAFALVMMLAGCSKDSVTPELPEIPEQGKMLTLADKEEIRTILLEFYEATGGHDWIEQPNWKTEDDMRKWSFFEIDDNMIIFHPCENNLTGSLPESIFRLPLLGFDVEDNRLSGEIPKNIGQSGDLIFVYLSNNDFTGNLPVSLAECTFMEELDVSGNRLSGTLDPKIRDCISFRDFELEQQEGYGLTGIEALQPNRHEMEILLKIHDSLIGDKPNWTEESDPLKWDNMEWNGNGRVAVLSLWDYYAETLPAEISELTELRHLDMDGLGLKQVPDLGQLTKLEILWTTTNDLGGTVPDWLFKMKNLKVLFMYTSNLSGNIPEKFNELPQLQLLEISDNPWTGKIPVLDKLTSLKEFYCNYCPEMDEQPVPDWLGNLTHLEGIYMDNINLSGELPESWKNLRNLEDISLIRNNISGNLPEYLADFSSELYLDVTKNRMTGNIPEAVMQHERFEDWDLMPQQEGYGFTNLSSSPAQTKADAEKVKDKKAMKKEKIELLRKLHLID